MTQTIIIVFLLVAFFVANIVWAFFCNKINNEWKELCLKLNEDWKNLCSDIRKEYENQED